MSRLKPRSASRRALQTDAGVLPLINVVFLLLIFFMIAGRIAEQAPFEVEPPSSRAEGDARREEVLILLDAQGRAAVGGEEMSRDQVAAHLAVLLDGPDAEAPEARAVRLRADAAVDSATVIALIEELRRAGVRKVTLMTSGGGS